MTKATGRFRQLSRSFSFHLGGIRRHAPLLDFDEEENLRAKRRLRGRKQKTSKHDSPETLEVQEERSNIRGQTETQNTRPRDDVVSAYPGLHCPVEVDLVEFSEEGSSIFSSTGNLASQGERTRKRW